MSRAARIRALGLIAFVVLWEAVAQLGLVSPILLAPPSEVVAALMTDGGVFLEGLALTVAEIGLAVALAWSLGIGFGLLAGSSGRTAEIIGPLLASLFAVPVIILYPLFIAWVGMGPGSKVLFGVISGFFPIALNTLSGLRQVDPDYATMSRAMGANGVQVFLKVYLLMALPAIISGLRIGTALVVIGVVVTEMLASLGGVGFLISYHRTLFDTGHVYLGITLALLVVLAVNWGLSRLERRFGGWRELQQAAG